MGSTTSACHSFKRGHPVCLGYVEGEGQDSVVLDGQLEIDIAGSLFPVSVSVSHQKSQSNLQYDADVSLDMK